MINARQLHMGFYQGAKELSSYHCSLCDEEIKNGENTRKHFHGSEVGKCKRMIYYDLHFRGKTVENGKDALFLFAGHMFEALLVRALSNHSNVKIDCNDGENDIAVRMDKQVCVEPTKPYVNVTVVGHYDAILNGSVLLEIKAVRTNSFKTMFQKGLVRENYKGQINFYLDAKPELKQAFLVGIHRETCEIAEPIEVKRDTAYINEKYSDYAKILYYGLGKNNLVTRDHENLNDYECKWCSYRKECEQNLKPSEFNFDV